MMVTRWTIWIGSISSSLRQNELAARQKAFGLSMKEFAGISVPLYCTTMWVIFSGGSAQKPVVDIIRMRRAVRI
jgi:hypothetical protein